MLGGAYSTQYKNVERQHVDTIKTLAENEKSDAIARARKLSVETNRRRRALAIKRKCEAEREEKRRQQILAKRREKQNEATEKFQRGHILSRPGSGSSTGRWSPHRTNIHTQLEDALKIVRGSPVGSRAGSARTRNQSSPSSSFYRQNSDPLSKPYFNKYAHPSINNGHSVLNGHTTHHKQEELHSKSLRNLNNSRNLFEQQLESYQHNLLEQQQKTLREFNKQMMKEIEIDKNVINNETNEVNGLERSESLSTVDSLEDDDSNDTLRNSWDINAFMTQTNEQSSYVNGAKTVTFADNKKEAVKIYGSSSHVLQSGNGTESQNIDSYNAQIQTSETPSQRPDEQKQQFYIQRQKEIQQQLQDQQQQQQLLQQKQQKELQQKVLEQQQNQQQLLQQQYKRQKQEEFEQQRQQDELKQQRQQDELKLLRQQEQRQKQDELKLLRQQEQRQKQDELKQRRQQEQRQKQEELEQRRQQEQRQKQEELEQQRHQEQRQKQDELKQRRQQEQRQKQEELEQRRQQEQRQKQEELEQRQQQEQRQKQEELEQQRHQEQRQKQDELVKQRQQEQACQQQAAVPPTAGAGYTNSEDGKENQRPKVQTKAWATPSPHPPALANTAITTAQVNVTHASPYTGKNTHTNMTVPMVTTCSQSSISTIPVSQNNNSNATVNQTAEKHVQSNTVASKSEYFSSPVSAQEKDMSFLETVTYGLPVTYDTNSVTSAMSSSPATRKTPIVSTNKSAQQISKSNTNSGASAKLASASKPPTHPGYYNSYGAAYAARQKMTNDSNSKKQALRESPSNVTMAVDTSKMNGTVTWGLPEGLEGHLMMMTHDTALNDDDMADTDSVSTICEEREPEPREVRSILKRTGSGKRTGSILKKSGSTGNMEIRDSLEITRVHLQTSAEEKEQMPTKKNVRFADLCYDDEQDQNGMHGDDDILFVKRHSDSLSQKPPRPVSAVTAKVFTPKLDNKPPRASSATVRTSTIPRAKTQIVRPQASAHIISQNLEMGGINEKVTIVNSNFMEKVPAMARANQFGAPMSPSSVYAATSDSYTQPQQKVNYAVSSIVMPKSESAPFIYPGYKQGLVPAGSTNGPVQGGNSYKYEGAVYDEDGVRIDRTPTDDEINYLWDKLRNCLSRNSQATPDVGQPDGQPAGSRQAAPVAHTYIDGNALGQFNSLNRVAHQPASNAAAIRRQNSLDSANNSYTRRYGLLQQRKQQPNPNSLKSRLQQQQQQQQGYTVYQAPVQSHTEPQTTGAPHNGADVTESMAGFLAAEQLADQSVSDSRIHQAIEEAQARQIAYNSARPQPKVKSALSVEEQRLMESLDRLNDKLKTTEGTIANISPSSQPAPIQQPTTAVPQQHTQRQQQMHRSSFLTPDGKEDIDCEDNAVGGFKGHIPITQRRVIEAGNHRARLRITSASLKRNIHRHQ